MKFFFRKIGKNTVGSVPLPEILDPSLLRKSIHFYKYYVFKLGVGQGEFRSVEKLQKLLKASMSSIVAHEDDIHGKIVSFCMLIQHR